MDTSLSLSSASSSLELYTSKIPVYKPVFDLETGKYIDEIPILPRQNMEFKCLCNNKSFNTVTKFKTHISLKCHQRYVACYLDHLQDSNELKEEMNKLRAKYELNERKIKAYLKVTEEQLKETEQKLEIANKTIQELVNRSSNSMYD